MKSGTADLPLHNGTVPRWLSERMARLGREVVRILVEEQGADAFLTRLSDPFWFQSLGCVMGMDWHSSGITTSVMGALKRGLNPLSHELGIYVCGGRGRYSRATPNEIIDISGREGLDADDLIRSSRLSAKVDNSCLQDGFQIYLHNFILTREGHWAVVQQGMNKESGMARRYHWHSPRIKSFVLDPQAAVSGRNQGELINLSDSRSAEAHNAILDFSRQSHSVQTGELRQLLMPSRHDVRPEDIDPKRLGAVLAAAGESGAVNFSDLLMIQGLGPRTLRSLALVSEVLYGKPCRFDDPARFSFAHGGKDGHPFPVPLKVYDETLQYLGRSVSRSRVAESEKRDSLKRLHQLQLRIESLGNIEVDAEQVMDWDRRHSAEFGGRTVASVVGGPRRSYSRSQSEKREKGSQLELF
ncbi:MULTISPECIES: DUF763 domain-containing protein [unclassified Oceanispirochaeta]|uniref:DUF763 domain-containing protein n=1 Tax=unclassified Oceanispirochaeta TaxID=2635722 RepID=UPI000E09D8D3|nr:MULTISPECIES: DUF763 domain-containing protein [unclassified Oceanispirochaeta]MBF9015369.1 DUF763 domain-containing protein [Oceanispirochaeta sp. M2]NPD71828.1 DUF763 domain-containing protein [Oceanispirochaeta sp. M1]RDG32639.1 DUF763 domain-containing protein [Oceanispirochaeta sp. M1]